MNTEQVGILLVSTLNTTNNETVRTISNPNIGKLHVHIYILHICYLFSIKQEFKAYVHWFWIGYTSSNTFLQYSIRSYVNSCVDKPLKAI